MTQPKLLVVVDDNVNFAVRVWRYLAGPMEYGFDRVSLSAFERTSPDESFKLYWFGPQQEVKLSKSRGLLEAFLARCSEPDRETWCIFDKHGLRGRKRELPSWRDYYRAFTESSAREAQHRAWVMSSYGDLRWSSNPSVRPKTIESLKALRDAMGLRVNEPASEERAFGEFNVLVTGAGFELADHDNPCGASVGFPATASLLNTTMTFLKRDPAKSAHDFPVPFEAKTIDIPARLKDLDAWCDAVLSIRDSLDPPEKTGFGELEFREAFRRSLLEHDFGHQRQSLIAAQLGWDYWLTTNYSRFADRAIDDVASSRGEERAWRAITTSIESDAVAPELSGATMKDFAEKNRILVKLHGDVGQVWTMAIVGQDKTHDSKLEVRPQLHRMYAAAEAMLLSSLWVRHARQPRPELCRWTIVGHGLRDKAIVRLIATVIQRSPPDLLHELVHVTGARPSKDGEIISWYRSADQRENEIKSVFRQVLGEYADEQFESTEKERPARVTFVCPDGSALEYMAKLTSLKQEHARRRSGIRGGGGQPARQGEGGSE